MADFNARPLNMHTANVEKHYIFTAEGWPGANISRSTAYQTKYSVQYVQTKLDAKARERAEYDPEAKNSVVLQLAEDPDGVYDRILYANGQEIVLIDFAYVEHCLGVCAFLFADMLERTIMSAITDGLPLLTIEEARLMHIAMEMKDIKTPCVELLAEDEFAEKKREEQADQKEIQKYRSLKQRAYECRWIMEDMKEDDEEE